jgi:hypothetical protein
MSHLFHVSSAVESSESFYIRFIISSIGSFFVMRANKQ